MTPMIPKTKVLPARWLQIGHLDRPPQQQLRCLGNLYLQINQYPLRKRIVRAARHHMAVNEKRPASGPGALLETVRMHVNRPSHK
ncbi:hypothetical protein Bphy_0611 [Paraburkholderia phymatum STM815]|uniref:Uncharacterized protein n=1 Tax=Paraburkholderia phymatum (strain DSM 17167 / CIP 108236 / LMG 21445 / STM815) TaxID=391038 RepID=B2JEC4_PARP8|nr:hypothetical protein Bphy_0611 [Paraburkholderia phymatum STM815]